MPKLCQFENCKKQANYGREKEKKIFCRQHKTDDTKNMSAKMCEFESCKKQPGYGFVGTPAKFCVSHKLDGMVDLKSRSCEFIGCKLSAAFNFSGENKRRFCSFHKLDGMIDVVHKKCEFKDCKISPSYNFECEPTPRLCFTHKLEGMIAIKKNICSFEECKFTPSFNFENKKPQYCAIHKMNGMVDVVHKKCNNVNCNSHPVFNFQGKYALCCSIHKLDGMIDVKNPRCKNEGCPSVANKKYKNYCAYCFQNLFPLDPLTFQIRCKTKELAVRDFINANYEGFNHDKILEYGGCDCLTRRRIDHRKLIGNTLLCVETDENQHKSYSKEDEEARYNDLLVNFTCKYIIIRFNPDSYVNKKDVKSNPYISARLGDLKKEIDKQIIRIENNENSELLEVIYLYYDGYK